MPTPTPNPVFRWGDYQEALASAGLFDVVLTDVPFDARTHAGSHKAAAKKRAEIGFEPWEAKDVADLVDFFAPRTTRWIVVLMPHSFFPAFEAQAEAQGLLSFAPVPIVYPSSVRRTGDGPASACVWLAAARQRGIGDLRALPGEYRAARANKAFPGAKSDWLAQALLRDYSRPGDLVVDPCCGTGTFINEAAAMGRDAIGCDTDWAAIHRSRAEKIQHTMPDLGTSVPLANDGQQDWLRFGLTGLACTGRAKR